MNSRHWSSGDGSTIDYRLHTASQSHFTNILIHHSASMSTLSTLGTQWSYDQKILTLGDRCNDPDRRMQKLQSCTISTLSMYALQSSRLIIRWINPESSIKLRNSPPIPLSLSKLTKNIHRKFHLTINSDGHFLTWIPLQNTTTNTFIHPICK